MSVSTYPNLCATDLLVAARQRVDERMSDPRRTGDAGAPQVPLASAGKARTWATAHLGATVRLLALVTFLSGVAARTNAAGIVGALILATSVTVAGRLVRSAIAPELRTLVHSDTQYVYRLTTGAVDVAERGAPHDPLAAALLPALRELAAEAADHVVVLDQLREQLATYGTDPAPGALRMQAADAQRRCGQYAVLAQACTWALSTTSAATLENIPARSGHSFAARIQQLLTAAYA